MVNTRSKAMAKKQEQGKNLRGRTIVVVESNNDVDTDLVKLGNIQNRFTSHENVCEKFDQSVQGPTKYKEWHHVTMAAHAQMFQSAASLIAFFINVLGDRSQIMNRNAMLAGLVEKFNKLELDGLNCLITLKDFQGLYENEDVEKHENVDDSEDAAKDGSDDEIHEENDAGRKDWNDDRDEDSNASKNSNSNDSESWDGNSENMDDWDSGIPENRDSANETTCLSTDDTDDIEILNESDSSKNNANIMEHHLWIGDEDDDMDNIEITNEDDYKKAIVKLKMCEEYYKSCIEKLKRTVRKRPRSPSSESSSEESDEELPQVKRGKLHGLSWAKIKKIRAKGLPKNTGGVKIKQLDLSHHILARSAEIRHRDIKSKIENLEITLKETEAEIKRSQDQFMRVLTRFVKSIPSKDALEINQLLDED